MSFWTSASLNFRPINLINQHERPIHSQVNQFHLPLSGKNGVFAVNDRLSPCRLTNETLAIYAGFASQYGTASQAATPSRATPFYSSFLKNSPLVKATTEGVVRAPSEFSSTLGAPPSKILVQISKRTRGLRNTKASLTKHKSW